jgi:hypothetical protein
MQLFQISPSLCTEVAHRMLSSACGLTQAVFHPAIRKMHRESTTQIFCRKMNMTETNFFVQKWWDTVTDTFRIAI